MSDNPDSFDPTQQTFIILGADGETKILVAVPDVDAYYTESVNTSIAYASQIGACFIMLVVLLTMTPSGRLLKPVTVVHTAGLVIGTIRMVLAALYFPSPWNEFYAAFSGDYSGIPESSKAMSITTNTFTVILVILIQASLVLQAWTMAKMWSAVWKAVLGSLSLVVCLLALTFRLIYTVFQNGRNLKAQDGEGNSWVAHGTIIMSAVMICWFCALFNAPLVLHLFKNRGILLARRGISPMEVLIMTNGILMGFPVIFAGLEYGSFPKFEPATFTYTSVIIILPLGTLVAQRIASRSAIGLPTGKHQNGTFNSATPFKFGFTDHTARIGPPPPHSNVSHVGAPRSKERADPVDLELEKIDRNQAQTGRVHVNREFERREERT